MSVFLRNCFLLPFPHRNSCNKCLHVNDSWNHIGPNLLPLQLSYLHINRALSKRHPLIVLHSLYLSPPSKFESYVAKSLHKSFSTSTISSNGSPIFESSALPIPIPPSSPSPVLISSGALIYPFLFHTFLPKSPMQTEKKYLAEWYYYHLGRPQRAQCCWDVRMWLWSAIGSLLPRFRG